MKLLVPEVTGEHYSRTYLLALETAITETQVSSTSVELSFRDVRHFLRQSYSDDIIHSLEIHFSADTYIYHLFTHMNFERAEFYGMHGIRRNIEITQTAVLVRVSFRNNYIPSDSSFLIMFLKYSICAKVRSLMIPMVDVL